VCSDEVSLAVVLTLLDSLGSIPAAGVYAMSGSCVRYGVLDAADALRFCCCPVSRWLRSADACKCLGQ
jgi:hypothetical protein